VLYYLFTKSKVKDFDVLGFPVGESSLGNEKPLPGSECQMGFIQGILYNLRGLKIGLTSGRLLFWGMIRFGLIVLITVFLAVAILSYRAELTEFLWMKPGSPWVLWLWHLLSWTVSLVLFALSAILSFLVSQILFSAILMDHMSRITERKATGTVQNGMEKGFWIHLLHLVRQEIPRLVLPLLLSLTLLVLGWVTPFGPIVTLFSAAVSAIFLSWDNTDLVPARRMVPFRARFRFLLGSIPFHFGFGLPFLVPGLNLLFLSFAPVGATLYYVDLQKEEGKGPTRRSGTDSEGKDGVPRTPGTSTGRR
jgi:CysZ protein